MTRVRLVALWLTFCSAFALLAWLVRRGATERFDASIEHRLGAMAGQGLVHLGRPFTDLGLAEVTLGLAVVLGIAAFLLGRSRLAIALSMVWLSVPIELAFKWFLLFPLPDVPPLTIAVREVLLAVRELSVAELAQAPGSFPSGHVTRTAFLAALLICLLLGGRSWSARVAALPLVAGAAAFALLMGYTRVLTGQHTPTDVLGGYLLALALLVPALLLLGWPGRPRSRAVKHEQ